MKTETDDLKPCKVGFTEFCHILKTCLSFRRGHMWDTDDFNEAYVSFRVSVGGYNPAYVDAKSPTRLVSDWAFEFYQEATKDTHDYWLKIVPSAG